MICPARCSQSLQERDVNPDIWNRQDGCTSSFPNGQSVWVRHCTHELSRPAVLNFAVGLACLPRQGDRVPVGTKCYFTGWGATSYRSAKSITLQQTPLPIVSYQTCQAGNSWFQPVNNFSMVCAGFGGNTPISGCIGDSGGPLICKENGQWFVRGAVSWGDPKCRAGTTYTVFARISSFVDWIKKHTGL
ncbi:hypothetical protein QZH41_016242 [Actinostola sp. cb2023]|nr:hypothetical protein QZH41_016242 [Actinostola sp. cb2023]